MSHRLQRVTYAQKLGDVGLVGESVPLPEAKKGRRAKYQPNCWVTYECKGCGRECKITEYKIVKLAKSQAGWKEMCSKCYVHIREGKRAELDQALANLAERRKKIKYKKY